MMKIVDATWSSRVNVLVIECTDCGHHFSHPADRWTVTCLCGARDSLQVLRDGLVTAA